MIQIGAGTRLDASGEGELVPGAGAGRFQAWMGLLWALRARVEGWEVAAEEWRRLAAAQILRRELSAAKNGRGGFLL